MKLKINEKNLAGLSEILEVPRYNRSLVKSGIVHIGVGGFHRAHQAFYTDNLLNHFPENQWGICGVCLLEHDKRMYDVLQAQDGLYTLNIKGPPGTTSPAIIGSIVESMFAPENPEKVIEKLASPDTHLITLTITEGGYNFDGKSGKFKIDDPLIQWDLKNPKQPKTVFGYLTAAIEKRKNMNLPLTILSCDNIQHNGNMTREMLLSFIAEANPEMLKWINENVSFPNCMVDRITPSTTEADIQFLIDNYGIEDAWPVVTEAFHQWIIEDNFKTKRPSWEDVGAQFVKDVSPYEKMKLRLLNGGHTLLGLTGELAGYKFVHTVTNDPLFAGFLRKYMDEEVTPTLDPVEGVELENYKDSLIQRFGNEYIRDGLDRIILESSAKIPKFNLPVLQANLEKNGSVRKCSLVIASWYHYLETMLEKNTFDTVRDQMKDLLKERMEVALNTSPVAFIKTQSLFGNLGESKRFEESFTEILKRIQEKGIREAIQYEMNLI